MNNKLYCVSLSTEGAISYHIFYCEGAVSNNPTSTPPSQSQATPTSHSTPSKATPPLSLSSSCRRRSPPRHSVSLLLQHQIGCEECLSPVVDRCKDKGKCPKKIGFFTLSQTMGRWGVQSPKLFSENNHSVIFTYF